MLKLEALRVKIAGLEVLRGVCFEVPDQAVVALVGRNGAGKTTTLRAIMGLVAPEAGRILLDGQDLAAIAPHRRAHCGVGYAPENRQLVPEFTAEDNVLLPCLAMGLDRQETRRRLELVYAVVPELAALRKRRAAGLSGGQGKIVALARALAAGTRLVLLDEPFEGLAPALAASYAAALHRLRRATPAVAMLVTESSPALLASVADLVLYVERGAIGREPAASKRS